MRERIEPAHERTFFGFLLGFLVNEEDRLEWVRSVDRIKQSGSGVEGVGSTAFCLVSFSEDAALVGRDFGELSPEIFSWPKKDHLLSDRGVDGVVPDIAAASMSRGIELRLLGASGVEEISWCMNGSAVLGRASDV